MKKHYKKILAVILVLVISFVLWHKSFQLCICRFMLSKIQDGAPGSVLSYESLQWEGQAIVLRGFTLVEPAQQLTVDQINLEWHFSLKELCLFPQLQIIHPQLTLLSKSTSSQMPLPLLYPTLHLRPSVSISNGVLQFPASRFYFSLLPQEKAGSFGVLTLSYHPDPALEPLLRADLSYENEDLRIAFELHEADLRCSSPLVTLLFSSPEESSVAVPSEETLFGEIALQGEVLIDRFKHCKEATLQLDAHDLKFVGAERILQLRCKEISGSLCYLDPESGDTFGASGIVKEAECHLPSGWQLAALNGSFETKLQQGLETAFQGTLCHGGQILPFSLQAQGEFFEGMLRLTSCYAESGGMLLEVLKETQGVEATLQGEMQQMARFLFPAFCGSSFPSLKEDLKLSLGWDKEGISCALSGLISEDFVEANFSFAPFLWQEWITGNGSCLLREGSVQFPQLHLKPYAPLLRALFPSLQLAGVVSCEAVFSPERLQMTLQPEELQISYEGAELSITDLAEEKMQFAYDWHSGRFALEAPFSHLNLRSLGTPIFLEESSGTLKLTREWLEIANFSTFCGEIPIEGVVKADFVKEKRLQFLSTRIHASLDQLQAVLRQLPGVPHLSLPLTGELEIGQKGLMVSVPLDTPTLQPEWALRATLSQVAYGLDERVSFSECRGELMGNSKTRCFVLEKGEGKAVFANGAAFLLQAKRLNLDWSKEGKCDFSLRALADTQEIAKLEGAFLFSSPSWELSLDPQMSHVLGVRLQMQKCVFNPEGTLKMLELRPQFKAQDLYPIAQLLQKVGVIPSTTHVQFLPSLCLQGNLQTCLVLNGFSEGIALSAASTDLRAKGESYAPFQLQVHLYPEEWRIDRLQAGALSLKGALTLNAEGFTVPQFESSWKTLALKGSGSYKQQTQHLSCSLDSIQTDLAFFTPPTSSLKGSLTAGAKLAIDFSSPQFQVAGDANVLIDLQEPVPLILSNKKPIHFRYQPQEGWVTEGLDVQVKQRSSGTYLAELKSTKLLYPKEGYLAMQEMEFSLTPALKECALVAHWLPPSLTPLSWEGNLQIKGDYQCTPAGSRFMGSLNPGKYGWNEKELNLEQVQLSYDKNALHIRTKTFIEGQPLWGTLQLDLGKEMYGVLKLFDHPKSEGLTLTFRSQLEGLHVESIEGSCYGLECQLKPHPSRKLLGTSSLTGTLAVDLTRLLPLFPDALQKRLSPLKMGSGYTWQGDLVLWQEGKKGFLANGTLQGQEFEALGYRLNTMHALIDASSERITLSQLKIEDAAGFASMKKMEIVKQQDKWMLHIPQVDVENLQPSLLRKVGVEPGLPKPFVVQQFSLTEIRGELGNLPSLEGSGYLTFENQVKKESSLFDLPLEIIKKVGLDLGLLTPVEGELQLELRGDKFYFLSLDQAYSEAKRSEFYLAPSKNLSYIDLSGNVHIDLKMRQDVMLKVIEPFTLTIRGTLDKPRYGLQF